MNKKTNSLRQFFVWPLILLILVLIFGLFSYTAYVPTTNIYVVLLSALFIVLFSFNLTCIIRTMYEHIARKNKTSLISAVNLIFGFVGMLATHACLANGYCAITIGMTLMSSLFPVIVAQLFQDFSFHILVLSTIVQIYSFVKLECYKNIFD